MVGAEARPEGRLGEAVLTVLLSLTLLSAVQTLAALAWARRRVDALQGRADTDPQSGWYRLVDLLVPDPVLIHSFPAMGLTAELRELTRQRLAPQSVTSRPVPRAGAHALAVRDLERHGETGSYSR